MKSNVLVTPCQWSKISVEIILVTICLCQVCIYSAPDVKSACPSTGGWHLVDGLCLLPVKAARNYTEAWADCASRAGGGGGGGLAVPLTASQQSAVRDMLDPGIPYLLGVRQVSDTCGGVVSTNGTRNRTTAETKATLEDVRAVESNTTETTEVGGLNTSRASGNVTGAEQSPDTTNTTSSGTENLAANTTSTALGNVPAAQDNSTSTGAENLPAITSNSTSISSERTADERIQKLGEEVDLVGISFLDMLADDEGGSDASGSGETPEESSGSSKGEAQSNRENENAESGGERNDRAYAGSCDWAYDKRNVDKTEKKKDGKKKKASGPETTDIVMPNKVMKSLCLDTNAPCHHVTDKTKCLAALSHHGQHVWLPEDCQLKHRYLCAVCPSGYKLNKSNYKCEQCPDGEYKDHPGDDLECSKCKPGFISTGEQKSECVCPKGKEKRKQEIKGKKNWVCSPCPDAKFKLKAGNEKCQNCPKNTVTIKTDRTRCVCTAGFESLDGSSSNCRRCLQNTYKDVGGHFNCKPCPVNSLPNTDKTLCQCKPGFEPKDATAPPDKLVCVPCSRTRSKAKQGNGKCQKCKWNSLSSSKRTSCLCKEGYQLTTNYCEMCPEKHFKDEIGNHRCKECPEFSVPNPKRTECECAPGHQPDESGRKCSLCPEGTHKPKAGRDQCISCPGDTFPNSKRSECVCPPGHEVSTNSSGRCIECDTYLFSNRTEKTICCHLGSVARQENGSMACVCQEGLTLVHVERAKLSDDLEFTCQPHLAATEEEDNGVIDMSKYQKLVELNCTRKETPKEAFKCLAYLDRKTDDGKFNVLCTKSIVVSSAVECIVADAETESGSKVNGTVVQAIATIKCDEILYKSLHEGIKPKINSSSSKEKRSLTRPRRDDEDGEVAEADEYSEKVKDDEDSEKVKDDEDSEKVKDDEDSEKVKDEDVEIEDVDENESNKSMGNEKTENTSANTKKQTTDEIIRQEFKKRERKAIDNLKEYVGKVLYDISEMMVDHECHKCPPGTYKDTVGNGECSKCSEGKRVLPDGSKCVTLQESGEDKDEEEKNGNETGKESANNPPRIVPPRATHTRSPALIKLKSLEEQLMKKEKGNKDDIVSQLKSLENLIGKDVEQGAGVSSDYHLMGNGAKPPSSQPDTTTSPGHPHYDTTSDSYHSTSEGHQDYYHHDLY